MTRFKTVMRCHVKILNGNVRSTNKLVPWTKRTSKTIPVSYWTAAWRKKQHGKEKFKVCQKCSQCLFLLLLLLLVWIYYMQRSSLFVDALCFVARRHFAFSPHLFWPCFFRSLIMPGNYASAAAKLRLFPLSSFPRELYCQFKWGNKKCWLGQLLPLKSLQTGGLSGTLSHSGQHFPGASSHLRVATSCENLQGLKRGPLAVCYFFHRLKFGASFPARPWNWQEAHYPL